MQFTLAALALVAAATAVSAQGLTSTVSPSAPAPSGCATTYPGNFEISVVLPNKKRDLVEKRDACAAAGTLVANLAGGILHDAAGRIGAIVANRQFQFDGPPAQTGTIYNAGWSVCGNGSLALGGSALFYQCLSGSFYNLYDQSIGGQCQAVLIQVIPCTVGGGISAAADGQPTAASARVSQQSDGQPTAASAKTVVSQIADGQIQATSARTVVSQIADGQIQATGARPLVPVTQISDGQIQATAKATVVVSQISDGQIQVTSAKPATTSSKSVVVQISDGQIQNSVTSPPTTMSIAPVTPTTSANATRTPAATSPIFTGGASYLSIGLQFVLGAAAVVAIAML